MSENKEIVKRVIGFIENNLEYEINLETIAESIAYSKFHLNRIFTEETGCTIYKYLRARRLTVAAKKLVDTDEPIAQIAYDAGYHSQQAFSLAFKRVYLYPPKVYRDLGVFVPKQDRMSMRMCSVSDYGRCEVYARSIEVAVA